MRTTTLTGRKHLPGCIHCAAIREPQARQQQAELGRKLLTRHGHYHQDQPSPTYNSWSSMKARCSNPNNSCWKNYGGAGVKVCDRWLVFLNFLADMGERPLGTSIGRFGDKGNYEPGNCAWQTPAEQGVEKRKKKLS